MGDWSGVSLPSPFATFSMPAAEDFETWLDELTAIQANWTSFTPTWTSNGTPPAIGNGTIDGHYNRVNNWFQMSIVLTIGSTSTFGTGSYRFTLPAGWTFSNDRVYGVGACVDASATTYYLGISVFATSTTFTSRIHNVATGGGLPTSAVPFTWTTSDKWYLTAQGELA